MSRRVLFPTLLLVTFSAFLAYRSLQGQETAEAYTLSRGAQQGKAVSPVALNLKGKRPTLVFLGSYLVNAHTSCNSCHTCPSYRGIDPYKGLLPTDPTPVNTANFLSGGTPFLNGSIIAPSLTPDSSGKPAGLTYAQFKAAMQSGTSAHNAGHILQIMPWPVYRNMDEQDLRAIYQYLSSIPAAPSGAGQCTGPDQTR